MSDDRPQGVDRMEPWLTLADDQTMRRQVARMAGELWSMTLCGATTPAGRAVMARMQDVREGDLVVETSAIHPRSATDDRTVYGVGYLVRVDKGSNEFMDTYFVQYGPDAADVVRWQNCTFIAIPREGDDKWTHTLPV